jgi:hypothetical protein
MSDGTEGIRRVETLKRLDLTSGRGVRVVVLERWSGRGHHPFVVRIFEEANAVPNGMPLDSTEVATAEEAEETFNETITDLKKLGFHRSEVSA